MSKDSAAVAGAAASATAATAAATSSSSSSGGGGRSKLRESTVIGDAADAADDDDDDENKEMLLLSLQYAPIDTPLFSVARQLSRIEGCARARRFIVSPFSLCLMNVLFCFFSISQICRTCWPGYR